MPKPFLKNSGGGGLILFPMNIRGKMNVIAQLEFELVYFGAAAQHFRHNTTGTSSRLRVDRTKYRTFRNVLYMYKIKPLAFRLNVVVVVVTSSTPSP